MSDAKLWACPCCGGETVWAAGGRACTAGCRYDGRPLRWITDWWRKDGVSANEIGARGFCRDLPGPCGTRPDGADVPIVASVPSPASQVTVPLPPPVLDCACPRCGGAAPLDATGEPWCGPCGAQARWLRAVEPEGDPYAAMRAKHAARMRSVCLASAHAANVLAWDDYHGKPRFFSLPCIHAATRGMTPCACERAERGRGAT